MKRLFFWGLAFSVVVIAIESLSFVLLSLFPFDSELERVLDQSGPENIRSQLAGWDLQEPHPYFGYASSAEKMRKKYDSFEFNNYSFFSPYDYPYTKKTPREFTIGVFGGSVAQILASRRDEFVRTLKKHVPGLRDRPITILNMALPAAKQPQQFIICSFFMGMYDFVINIDGFNEVATPVYQQFPVEWPHSSDVLYNNADLAREMEAKIRQMHHRAEKMQYLLDQYGRSQTLVLFLKAFRRHYINKVKNSGKRLRSLYSDNKGKYFYGKNLSDLDYIEKKVRAWRHFSVLQSQLLLSNHVPYLFFVQPHLLLQKVLVGQEVKFAQSYPKHYGSFLPQGYSLLEATTAALQKDGVNIVSLTGIFSDWSREAYVDLVHLNNEANVFLMETVALAIKRHCSEDLSKCSTR